MTYMLANYCIGTILEILILTIMMIFVAQLGLDVSINAIRVLNQGLNHKGW